MRSEKIAVYADCAVAEMSQQILCILHSGTLMTLGTQ